MTFNDYQYTALKNKVYGYGTEVVYPALGLAGESGEVVDKVKKVLRDYNGDFTLPEKRIEIAKELGDVLWYCAAIADDLGYDFDMIAEINLDKIKSRKERGVIHGSGDER